MDENLKKKINDELEKNEVCLFMKGTPETPQCGFSLLSIYERNSGNSSMWIFFSCIECT